MTKKMRSLWDDIPATWRKWTVRGAACAGFLGALTGAIAVGPAALNPEQAIAAALVKDRAELARQAAVLDTVRAEQRAALARDREQTRILLYLQCGMEVARGKRVADCEGAFIDGTIERGGTP